MIKICVDIEKSFLHSFYETTLCTQNCNLNTKCYLILGIAENKFLSFRTRCRLVNLFLYLVKSDKSIYSETNKKYFRSNIFSQNANIGKTYPACFL